ncbi:efflux RND transporter periplasmic adaptor subunit [Kiritimatiellota bacterium B12222]|nr:efflux RND transporter periplasmic adaptor subunit [Kiritimatiellota bacterium B12222]
MHPNRFISLFTILFSLSLFAQEPHDHDDHAGHDHATTEVDVPHNHDDHAGHDHDDHEGHDHGEHENTQAASGAIIAHAGPGFLAATESFPAEVGFNQDRLVHLVPKVSGVVAKVNVRVGDLVKKGQTLALIESRELADIKSNFLAASARYELTNTRRIREQRLREEQVNSIEDVLTADQAAVEAHINLQSATQKLLALGLDAQAITDLKNNSESALTSYPLRAPMAGTIIERHLTNGEHVDADTSVLTLADLTSVWVDASVPPSSNVKVKLGERMELMDTRRNLHSSGEVILFTPFADPERRTLTARLEVDNSSGDWIPGLFATVHPRSSEEELDVVIPRSAVQRIGNENVVFIPSGSEFITTEVTLGASDDTQVQILHGLNSGDPYVREGAFTLKAIMMTQDMDPHAGHGH